MCLNLHDAHLFCQETSARLQAAKRAMPAATDSELQLLVTSCLQSEHPESGAAQVREHVAKVWRQTFEDARCATPA
ncbi:MAG: hypothetical protein WAX89_00185 [Alphaproteobacteria bacterium]